MTVFQAGAPVIVGVDAVLRQITTEVLKDLSEPVGVTVGPLDRPIGSPRLNWFLYRITPAAAYANMEFPSTGWTNRRGHPPLALTLHYLFSAEPGELTESGDDETSVHAALSAVMSGLHDNGIFGLDTQVGSAPDVTVGDVTSALDGMLEPLRITLAATPMETITALWTPGSRAIRLSVGYDVSLVTVPVEQPFASGPPVLQRVLGVGPASIPAISRIAPATITSSLPSTVLATGLLDDVHVTLTRLRGDPDDPTGPGPWVLASAPASGGIVVSLPGPGLVPGPRTLTVSNLASGFRSGSARGTVTVVPRIVTPVAPLTPGAVSTLRAEHVVTEGRLFFRGRAVAFTVASPATLAAPATITATVPPDLTPGEPVPVSVRAGPVTGPPEQLAVAP